MYLSKKGSYIGAFEQWLVTLNKEQRGLSNKVCKEKRILTLKSVYLKAIQEKTWDAAIEKYPHFSTEENLLALPYIKDKRSGFTSGPQVVLPEGGNKQASTNHNEQDHHCT